MSEEKSEVKVKDLRTLLQKFNEDLGKYINGEERYKLGRVLTIIDASIADHDQRKAIKDLINAVWWNPGDIKPSPGEMSNPHSDIRAICQSLGFDLYQTTMQHGLPEEYSSDSYNKKRYDDALKTSK